MLLYAELLTKYFHEPNFAGYYSQNTLSNKHMVYHLKTTFFLPRNAGLDFNNKLSPQNTLASNRAAFLYTVLSVDL